MEEKPAVVKGEFVTYSHLKTRKTFSIVIEFPEEQALHVLNTLGSPIGGNSKPVAVALLDRNQVESSRIKSEQAEGEKLRTRAVLLCESLAFQEYSRECYFIGIEDTIKLAKSKNCSIHDARCMLVIYQECDIKSRSELATNIEAQNKFKELLEKFKDWQAEQQYADNLSKY